MLSIKYLWNIRNSTRMLLFLVHSVVNCFLIYIFEISETAHFRWSFRRSSCELLSNLYLWNIRNSKIFIFTHSNYVVNCFLIYIFEISETANNYIKEKPNGCELLSNLYLWNIRNSLYPFLIYLWTVVNCFLIYIFEISETADIRGKTNNTMLWIAF